jgi:hypothetical protein
MIDDVVRLFIYVVQQFFLFVVRCSCSEGSLMDGRNPRYDYAFRIPYIWCLWCLFVRIGFHCSASCSDGLFGDGGYFLCQRMPYTCCRCHRSTTQCYELNVFCWRYRSSARGIPFELFLASVDIYHNCELRVDLAMNVELKLRTISASICDDSPARTSRLICVIRLAPSLILRERVHNFDSETMHAPLIPSY